MEENLNLSDPIFRNVSLWKEKTWILTHTEINKQNQNTKKKDSMQNK